jgi:hypothetical protein
MQNDGDFVDVIYLQSVATVNLLYDWPLLQVAGCIVIHNLEYKVADRICKASDIYSEGIRFTPQPEKQIFWDSSRFFSAPPGKCRNIVLN